MFFLAVLDSVRLVEDDLGFSFFIHTESGLFFQVDKLIHMEEKVLDLIVNFAIDLPGTVLLEPFEFFSK